MKYLSYIVLFIFAIPTFADSHVDELKSKADGLYADEKYEEAIELYLELANEGENSDVYYNLGNCYYRTKDIAHSILWYERALLLSPGDRDIRFNLNLARTKTVDKYVQEDEMFFTRWYHGVLNFMGVNGWVWTSIVLFALLLVGVGLYMLASRVALRKCGFYGALVLFVFFVLSNVFAYQQYNRLVNRNDAIVMPEEVVLKSTPNDSGKDLVKVHAGTSVHVLDNSMKEWHQVRLADGNEGWVPSAALEVI